MRLSVLDISPVASGSSPAEALRNTLDLAQVADALGYTRYWLAEHHAMGGLADAAPEVLLARLVSETSRIRLGSGGVMLPHYAPFKVAEAFRMLEALAPGRIDLGIGRAPGGTSLVSAALETGDVRAFPDHIQETIDFLDGTTPTGTMFASLSAMPTGRTSPAVWLLGSSEYGAMLAAHMGLPYVYAHFIGGDAPATTRAYRENFQPSARGGEPRVIVALSAIAADTDDEAYELWWPIALWRMRMLRGHSGPIPSLAEFDAYPLMPRERQEMELTRRVMTGTPAGVRQQIGDLVDLHGADEALVISITPTYESRLRSYELIANAFALSAA